jgi:hypothetical protein
MTDDDVRRAAGAELCGYWAQAVRRPLWWLTPVIADLGLTSMARGRRLAPGQRVASPRGRTALIAWQDARRTIASARRAAPD